MDIQRLVSDYAEWLKDETYIAQAGQYYELTTPFLDRFSDHMQIYVKQYSNGGYEITDGGYMIDNLESSGVVFVKNSKRSETLNKTLRKYGVRNDNGRLYVKAEASDFPSKKHMLLQAMMAVDDMFITETNKVKEFFAEDVGVWMDSREILYSRNISIAGKANSNYTYEYHIQRTKEKPERFCRAINSLRRDNRDMILLGWLDTVGTRQDEGKLIVFANDENRVNSDDVDALAAYEIDTILWSERERYVDMLAG